MVFQFWIMLSLFLTLSFSPNLSLLLTMVLSSAFCLYEETPSQDLKILWHTCFQIARLPNCQIAKLYLSLFLTNPTFELSAIQSYIMTIFFKLSHSRPLFSFFVSWMQLMVERWLVSNLGPLGMDATVLGTNWATTTAQSTRSFLP